MAISKLLTVGAAGLAILIGAGPAKPCAAKTLVYCSEGSPENFNPMLNNTGTTFDANHPIYDRLVAFRPGGVEAGPALAESWDRSADGKIFLFHLRHGVKWQSNTAFTPTRDFGADDVIFSFDRQWKDDNPYHKISAGGYSYFEDMDFPKLLAAIDKVDDYTVRFVLNTPQAAFISDLAMEFASIQSEEYADTLMKAGTPEQIDQMPIGTGPYELQHYQRDSTIRYRAFKDYWGPKPKIDTLVFSINRDAAVRLAKLRANECQIMAYPNLADLAGIRADPDLVLQEQVGLNVGYLSMNVTKKPFDDVRVRRAINMAVDKQAILDAVYQGAGQPAKNLIPPAMWSYNNAVRDFPYDPAAAKRLLAEAGLANGFETDLWAMPVQRPYNPDARHIAELMQSDLAKIGIKARIVSYEWGEYRKRMQAGEDMMGEAGWTSDNGDPDNFFTPLASCAAARPGGGNAAKWCDPAFDALIRQAATLTDPGERARLYEQAQSIMHDDAPFYLIAHAMIFMPMRKTILNYEISPFDRHEFENVDLK